MNASNVRQFIFLLYGATAVLFPFLPLYFQDLGFSPIQIGLFLSIGPLVSMIANPFWGYWSDRIQNPRLVLILLLSASLCFSQVFFQMENFITVLLLLISFYFFQVAIAPITDSLILSSIDNTRYQYGSFRLWGSLGFAITSVAVGSLLKWLGIENLGFIFGVIIILNIIFGFGLPRGGVRQPNRIVINDLVQSLMKNGYYVLFLIYGILISIPNIMNNAFLSIYIHDLGGSEIYVGWAFFLGAIIEIPVFLLLDRYLKKTPVILVGGLLITTLLFAVRWLLMGIAVTPMQVIWLQIMNSVTFGSYLYIGTQFCAYLVPNSYRAIGISVFAMTWMGLSGLLGSLLGGWLYDVTGPRGMYGIGFIMTLIGVVGFSIMWKTLKRLKEKDNLYFRSYPVE
jgi:PPP family 3-phenylpropionic acid transporter